MHATFRVPCHISVCCWINWGSSDLGMKLCVLRKRSRHNLHKQKARVRDGTGIAKHRLEHKETPHTAYLVVALLVRGRLWKDVFVLSGRNLEEPPRTDADNFEDRRSPEKSRSLPAGLISLCAEV